MARSRSKAKSKAKSKSKAQSSLKTASSCESARNQWSSLPWSKVETDKTNNNNDNDNNNNNSDDHNNNEHDNDSLSSFLQGSNHYDNPRANPSELYAADSRGLDYVEGANDPGIMLGLEVIDGSQYRVEKVAVRNEVTREQTGFVTRLVMGDDLDGDGDRIRIETAEEKVQVNSPSPPPAASDNDKDKDDSNVKAKDNSNANADMSSLSRKEKNKLKLEKLKAKRKEIKLKKKRKREREHAEAQPDNKSNSNSKDDSKSTNQSSSDANNKQMKRKKSNNTNANATQAPVTATVTVTETQMQSIRVSWSIATGGVYLHPKLCASLHRLNFINPTPIQSSTLAASILGHRDVVGAAPTGSGKTLSYLLPILHCLLTEADDKQEEEAPQASSLSLSSSYPLTALILCPTRELAMQVSMEFAKLMNHNQRQRKHQPYATDNDNATNETDYSLIRCGTIVGGLSEQKQKRVLDVKRPPVLVGTPGRLWDLMSTNDHAHLNDLKQLRFIVIDEADRMINQGSFPQLQRIFERIQQANPSLEYMAKHEEDYIYGHGQGEEGDEEDGGRMMGLPGIRGEAKVQMLDDRLLAMIEKRERADRVDEGEGDSENENDGSDDNDDNDSDDVPPQPIEMDDDEYEAQQAKFEQDLQEMDHFNNDGDSNDDDEEEEMVKRQTFVFSATLTLPTSSHQNIAAQSKKGKKNKKGGKVTVDGAIAEILEKVGAQGQTKVVDLSTNSKIEAVAHTHTHTPASSSNKKKSKDEPEQPSAKTKVQLPPGLSLYEMRCTQKHKDSHLYSFLTNTKQGASGPSLVFCNSINAVKRVGETLKVLGLPVRMLHAQMQQKARLSSLESLNRSNARSIVVATDVAARGLDIPSVASVIHYDVARAVDTFVHRAGRTARGMGEKAVGWSISLVSAPEEKSHRAICRSVNGDVSSFFDTAPMDSRLLSIAQERVNLASKIVVCEEAETKTNKSNQWFTDAANDAGLDLDEDLLDDGQLGGSKKERQQFLEAKRARQELKMLLSKPMRKQAFGKFLSNAGLREAIQAEKEVKPYIVDSTAARQGGKKKKKRKIKK